MNLPRLPDFVLIGVMKSGTTSLFRWLDDHPDVSVPRAKEPNFFSDARRWQRGVGWYADLFAEAPPHRITGEASVAYTDPRVAPVAAERLTHVVPEARLLCLLREPEERLRSHYRHEVLRGREKRPLREALLDPASPYIRRSRYADALRPWLCSPTGEQTLVLTHDELFAGGTGWDAVLAHLGLRPWPRPSTRHNATASKEAFTPMMRWLWDHGVTDWPLRPPQPARKAVRTLLLRPPDRAAVPDGGVDEPLPDWLHDLLQDQVARTEHLIGRPLTGWRSP